MSRLLAKPRTIRFSKVFWDNINELAEFYQVLPGTLVRMKIEESVAEHVRQELERVKQKRKRREKRANQQAS